MSAGTLTAALAPVAIGVFWYNPRLELPFVVLAELLVIWAFLLSVAARSWRLAANEARESAVEAMHRDRRAPILYLRDFRTDGPSHSAHRSYEHGLARLCSKYGPTVALGQPDDEYQPAGFARIYMSNEEWRLGLSYLLERLGLVIINPMLISASLEWELSRCVERALGKVVILTWHERFDYTTFRESVERLFPHGLPALADPTHSPTWLLPRFDFADGVISFDREGRARHTILSAMSTPLAFVTGGAAYDYGRRLRAFLREKGLEPRDSLPDRIKRVAMNDLAHPARSWILSVVGSYVALWLCKAWLLYRGCQAYHGTSRCFWWMPPFLGN